MDSKNARNKGIWLSSNNLSPYNELRESSIMRGIQSTTGADVCGNVLDAQKAIYRIKDNIQNAVDIE